MTDKTPKFVVDDEEYIIKPKMYPILQSFLYRNERVSWVSYDEPFITYGFKTGYSGEKKVKRRASELLTDSRFGRFIVSTHLTTET